MTEIQDLAVVSQPPKLLMSASSSAGAVFTSEQGFKMRLSSLEYKAREAHHFPISQSWKGKDIGQLIKRRISY